MCRSFFLSLHPQNHIIPNGAFLTGKILAFWGIWGYNKMIHYENGVPSPFHSKNLRGRGATALEEQKHILSRQALAEAVSAAVKEGGSFLLTVTGGSMVPALLHEKSQVELVEAGEIAPGDIALVLRKDGSLVLHRVIRREGDTLTINGDAQSWTEQAKIHQVLAKVRRICRKGRWYEVGSVGDKVYYTLWGLTRPLRPGIFKVYSKVKRK